MNLKDCKEIKQTVLREAAATRSLINRISKCQAIFFSHMVRGERKSNRGIQQEKMLG